MPESRITLPGSERERIPGGRPLPGAAGKPDPNQRLTVTVQVKRKQSIPTEVAHAGNLTREQLAADYGATAMDLMTVQQFAEEHSLTVVEESAVKRTVELSGTIQSLEIAFGTKLRNVRLGNATYRERSGPITLPDKVSHVVEGVFGLDNRPAARPHLRFRPATDTTQGFSPLDVARLYSFPIGTGAGQTIAIIELDGGFAPADINTYFASLELIPPSVTAVPVMGGSNAPTGDPGGPDGEVMLDIEVAGAIAHEANIKVYFAPNTDQGFLAAVNAAIHDTPTPTVVSISWGGPEESYTASNRNAFEQAFQNAAAMSIPVTVAAGDHGSLDGTSALTVDFPGAAPHALCCGGTKLVGSNTITSEVVWNDGLDQKNVFWATGGGVSAFFPKPSYQANVQVPAPPSSTGGRGVPDVCGEAASPGYNVRIDGVNTPVGGTSAVAPLMAGLIALMAQKLGHKVPFLNPILYANANSFHDIVTGNNDNTGGSHYVASAGWDPCTGLGSPNGSAILAAVASAPPAPTPPAPTPPAPHPPTPHPPTPHPPTPHPPTPHPPTPHPPTPHPPTPRPPTPTPGSGHTGTTGTTGNTRFDAFLPHAVPPPLLSDMPATHVYPPYEPQAPQSGPAVPAKSSNTVALVGLTAVVATVATVGIVAAVAAVAISKENS